MKSLFTLLAFVLFSIAICKKNKIRTIHTMINHDCKKNDFDFFILSLQYVPGMCYNNNCRNIESQGNSNRISNWTIHGLWPNNLIGRYEGQYCLKNELNLQNFDKNISDKLKIYWPSIFNSNSNSDFIFHNHEWQKHGSCISYCNYGISDDKAQNFYFSKTLELRDKFNPENFLVNTKFVNFDDLIKKFENSLNVKPQLICIKDNEDNNKQYLKEVRIPVNIDFSPYLINSFSPKSKCKKNIPINFDL
jgi:ribonuclease I